MLRIILIIPDYACSMVETRHFRLVVAIESTGSLTGAARELGISQPAASQQLRSLERQLGTPLTLRAGRRLRLTEAGEIVARHGRVAIEAAHRARTEVDLIAGLRGGVLRLTAFPSAAATLVPLALASLKRSCPDLTIRLLEAEAMTAMDQLRAGDADVALIGRYRSPGSVDDQIESPWVVRTVMDEMVLVALHGEHPLCAERVVALTDLAHEKWIAGCAQCRRNLEEAATGAAFSPDVAFETDDYVALQRLAGLGLGVSLIPELMVAAARVEPTLQFRPISPPRIRRVSMVVLPSALRVPGVSQLCQSIYEAARTLRSTSMPAHQP